MGSLVPLKVLFKYYWSDFIVLTYHSLAGMDAEPEINKNPYRTQAAFSRDIKFIRDNFNVLHISEFLEIIQAGKAFPEKSLLLTFDDGLAIQYDHMFPVLKTHKVPAVFFINNAFIDNRDLHYERKKYLILRRIDEGVDRDIQERIRKTLPGEHSEAKTLGDMVSRLEYREKHYLDTIAGELGISFSDYLDKNKIYLTTRQIKDMLGNQMSIGGHSMDHPNLTELPMDQQVNQVIESVNDLADRFSLDYKAFAFPYNDRALDTALFIKIKDGIDVSFGSSDFLKDEFRKHFHRGSIDNSIQSFKPAISAIFAKYYASRITGKHFIKRYQNGS